MAGLRKGIWGFFLFFMVASPHPSSWGRGDGLVKRAGLVSNYPLNEASWQPNIPLNTLKKFWPLGAGG